MQNRSISIPIRKIIEQDSEGFVKETWKYLGGIRASFKDTSRQDEILANQYGYEATVIVEIAACAYNGASFFVDEATGEIYDVKRSYKPEKSRMIQLTGERRQHGKIQR